MIPRILIAGIGNIFLGDDAFGSEVARRLSSRGWPEGVRVIDFGIRGFDLALALLDEAVEIAILVDALPRGGSPGTLYVIEPEWPEASGSESNDACAMETHALDPVKVFQLVQGLGGSPKRMLLVGCEPTPLDDAVDPSATLSEPVVQALDEAVRMVESLVFQIRGHPDIGPAPWSEVGLPAAMRVEPKT